MKAVKGEDMKSSTYRNTTPTQMPLAARCVAEWGCQCNMTFIEGFSIIHRRKVLFINVEMSTATI